MKPINSNILVNSNYAHAFAARMRGPRHVSDDDMRYLNKAAVSGSPLTLPAPFDLQLQFQRVRDKYGVFRRLCRVVPVTWGDNSVWITERTNGAAWLEPAANYPDIAEGVTMRKSTPHKLGCNCVLSEDLAYDRRFDFAGYMADVVGRRFALGEDVGFAGGSGNNGEPTGLVNQATAVDVSALDYAALRSTYFSVPSFYRSNATWILNDVTAETIRGLLDNAGRPLLDISNGLTLFGRPVEVCAGCADGLVLFGDFSTVWLLDRSPLFVVPLSELHVTAQEVGLHCWELVDIVATRPEAVAACIVSTTTETPA